MPIPTSPFYMIRHGQSTANLKGILSGSIDADLTDLGQNQAAQAKQTFERLAPLPTVIIHSDLSRAKETAQIINNGHSLHMIEDERLAEQNFGDWENQPLSKIRPYILQGQDPPNGETNFDFYKRTWAAFEEHLSTHTNPLLVCHGGLWRAFAAAYREKTEKPDNCTFYRFTPLNNTDSFPWDISKMALQVA